MISFGLLIYFSTPFHFSSTAYDESLEAKGIPSYNTSLNRLVAFTMILIGVGSGLFLYLQYGTFKQLTRTVVNSAGNSREPMPVAIDYRDRIIDELSHKSNPVVETKNTEPPLGYVLESKIALVQADYANIINRLVEEIERLGKVANYNLVFGSVATVAGIIILTVNAFDQTGLKDTTEILKLYIPRISTIVFIEIFAFFFLRIYKGNLADIKYFHNERTNIEQKILALKTSLLIGDSKYVKSVIDELAKTERNRILKKGETTVELERERAEITADKNVMSLLKSVLELKKDSKQ
ncbi:hypothetical protein BC343_13920 [Mucilaginibacter pedocola]|uniref:Uncharacterized protein n=2 Tax=Mucilaginibacter pedocola TaxID=1792845 RepID=A0A1S9PB78_9SPHI|nr:hypothetical protein BC343_13920 [Mucilaginibacter pedocola]